MASGERNIISGTEIVAESESQRAERRVVDAALRNGNLPSVIVCVRFEEVMNTSLQVVAVFPENVRSVSVAVGSALVKMIAMAPPLAAEQDVNDVSVVVLPMLTVVGAETQIAPPSDCVLDETDTLAIVHAELVDARSAPLPVE